ncbi:unnamed protein product [Phytophthora lilii]|uniref:Unnamed protein product n=1 Tax=Phytophthora lilii TaxID=2077276 RepID=A0A9W6TI58_9STRA|nr:unnamed protein product [Phytophthora lilii]
MEKLTRLDFENSELKKPINSETAERIDSLLDEIGDLSRLKKSFETKYFETHEALESTQVELRRMTESLLSARDEYQGRMERLTVAIVPVGGLVGRRKTKNRCPTIFSLSSETLHQYEKHILKLRSTA